MSSPLKERVAKLARPDEAQPTAAEEPVAPAAEPDALPDIDIEVPEGGPELVPVHLAWSRVMGDVRSIAKLDKVLTGPARYDFRGVDRTVNVFGPVCRKHGVLVLPHRVEASYRDTRTSTDKPTRECTVVVTYRIYGPNGDHLECQAAGESLDTGDKGSAKAQAVALRTLLLHGGLVPTQDADPDAHNVERGEAPVRPAASYVDEIANPRTSVARLLQIKHELTSTKQFGVSVTNEVGDDEPIGAMVNRIGKERSGGGQ